MKRPAIVLITAYTLLFQSMSVFMVVYPALQGGYFGSAPVIANSHMPLSVQWLVLCWSTLPNLVIAAGLLKGNGRARTGWIAFMAVATVFHLFDSGFVVMRFGVYVTLLNLGLFVLLYAGRADQFFRAPADEKPRIDKAQFQAIALHALAAFGMYATLSLLFSRMLPGDPSDVQSHAAYLMTMLGALIAIAYAIQPQRAPMLRETALLLLTLAGFLVILCACSQMTVDELYPAGKFQAFDWKDTLVWLKIIAATGAGLLLLSQRQSAEVQ
ncbi:hypothetical protein [Paraburkholderia azotifigens]|uniref:Uncharacterized protein n=1 Tax=Paraburkholderia azotifigens TaxID=2057004 RepID=A0A5C6V5Z5_9BURK|nr:hypothetical protein [Paraburkholderia azotifigens]TXC80672.1 hypothetical protein FRZ40_41215 [Paraburkholderia azotifigens]